MPRSRSPALSTHRRALEYERIGVYPPSLSPTEDEEETLPNSIEGLPQQQACNHITETQTPEPSGADPANESSGLSQIGDDAAFCVHYGPDPEIDIAGKPLLLPEKQGMSHSLSTYDLPWSDPADEDLYSKNPYESKMILSQSRRRESSSLLNPLKKVRSQSTSHWRYGVASIAHCESRAATRIATQHPQAGVTTGKIYRRGGRRSSFAAAGEPMDVDSSAKSQNFGPSRAPMSMPELIDDRGHPQFQREGHGQGPRSLSAPPTPKTMFRWNLVKNGIAATHAIHSTAQRFYTRRNSISEVLQVTEARCVEDHGREIQTIPPEPKEAASSAAIPSKPDFDQPQYATPLWTHACVSQETQTAINPWTEFWVAYQPHPDSASLLFDSSNTTRPQDFSRPGLDTSIFYQPHDGIDPWSCARRQLQQKDSNYSSSQEDHVSWLDPPVFAQGRDANNIVSKSYSPQDHIRKRNIRVDKVQSLEKTVTDLARALMARAKAHQKWYAGSSPTLDDVNEEVLRGMAAVLMKLDPSGEARSQRKGRLERMNG